MAFGARQGFVKRGEEGSLRFYERVHLLGAVDLDVCDIGGWIGEVEMLIARIGGLLRHWI